MALAAEDMVEFAVGGRSVRVMSRPAEDDQLARLFELEPNPTWSDTSPLTDDDIAVVVRGLIDPASKKGRPLQVLGVTPGAAMAFPDDPRIAVGPVEPLSFSLPGTPDGLAFQMDERGDGHLYALGQARLSLGSDGMWWIVTRLIEALEDPQTAATWHRFVTVAGSLGGPATQASLQLKDSGICIVWRRLESGVVGDIVSWQELSFERAQGWLKMLGPIRFALEQQRVHRQRRRAARTAEKWAVALERWSA
jgi:hypothetical protein